MRILSCSLVVLLGACSASGSKDGDPALVVDSGGALTDGGLSTDGGLVTDVDPEGGMTKPGGCSADLTSVTDESGVVQKKCPSDQGCFAGECIPACEAAAKSKGNVSCEFIAATPSFYPGITPPCFAVFLANNWSKAVKITVTRGGTSYDATSFARIAGAGDATSWPAVPASGLPQGKVAVLFLSSDPSSQNVGYPLKCPVPQAVPGGTAVVGTGKGTAFMVKTDAPVSGYDILPYGGATSFLPSAELLIPSTAWGTNYVAALPPKQSDKSGPLWAQIVASQNGTTVKINPSSALPAGGGAPAAPASTVTSFTLNAGEYVQWQEIGDISGSILSADKPVAFVGGTGYLCLTSSTSPGGGGCDSGHQLIPPISALGSEYVLAPYVTRRADLAPESILYRIVGTVDGTKLTFDPPVSGAPATIGRGTVAGFEATGPVVVKSDKDHPFYVAQMMAGALTTSGSRPGATVAILGSGGQLGDEEYVNLLPPAQFLSKYVFFTDPTYSTTNLVLTRAKASSGFKDVKIDCLGTVSGWTPAGKDGRYETVGVDLVRAAAGVGSCANGPHVAESEGPFGVMVWGTDTFASYAYPGGGNIGTINTVVVDPVK
jgi:hypothetical protein